MRTSAERGDGTSNIERIREEIQKASQGVDERFSGYRDMLVEAAVECYKLTAEHAEKRTAIDKKYDEVVSKVARTINEKRS
ncbi:hypothetical protein AB0L44_22075 [Nonomuraea wenchangensis]|uniref:hypothetical protein n=1 Tax=Nonomuraea wenchangensis TaxID=568860 RepID=UPI00342D2106